MKLAFCLFKLFPYGGLARDCMRIMSLCQQKGAEIDAFVMVCEGEIPSGVNVEVIKTKGLTNHTKVASYITQLQTKLAQGQYDLVIGFNRMPGLDLYYAADPCYIDRVKKQSNYTFMQFSPRVNFYKNNELAVFGQDSKTICLMISEREQRKFKQHYQIPDNRLVMLPPGIDKNRKRSSDWCQKRQQFRDEHAISDQDIVLLMIGSGFRRKGVDRTIRGIAALPDEQREKIKLFVVGQDNSTDFKNLAKKNGLTEQVYFLGGRDDVPMFLLGCDLFVHPARKESAGMVIIEALVSGLPLLVSGECGYASHVENAQAGVVTREPFEQTEFNDQLSRMLSHDKLIEWSKAALFYAEKADLYSMPERVFTIITEMTSETK